MLRSDQRTKACDRYIIFKIVVEYYKIEITINQSPLHQRSQMEENVQKSGSFLLLRREIGKRD